MYNPPGGRGYYGYPTEGPVMFKDYNKFIMDLQQAINDEFEAAQFYSKLMEMAPCTEAREQIEHARDDEMEHYKMLSQLYVSLTGQHPMVKSPLIMVKDFCMGIKEALNDELKAAEFYRSMLLSTTNMQIRDILFVTMTDEMEHATRFSFIYSLVDCEDPECSIENH